MDIPVKSIDDAVLAALFEAARRAPRLRTHHCLHENDQAPFHRLVIAAQPGTRIRAHRHLAGGKWELLVALAGRCDVLVFDDAGVLAERHRLAASAGGVRAVELPCDCWHCFVAMEPDSAFCEIKPGPYMRPDAGDWAAWSPAEDDPDSAGFEAWCRGARIGDRYRKGNEVQNDR